MFGKDFIDQGLVKDIKQLEEWFVHWLCVCAHYWWCSWLNAWGVQVAPYKKLRRVTFLEAIPRSSSGKILRRELTQKPISKLWSGFVSKQFLQQNECTINQSSSILTDCITTLVYCTLCQNTVANFFWVF
jgi:hypothetical protein